MFRSVEIPLWLLVLIVLFATVTFASHFLFPSVRWFFRKRMERAVARLNTRLARPIEPFKLARRHDMIQRLIYDPAVAQAVVEHAQSHGVPENVAFELAGDYAREIVPSFSATAYFTFGTRLAKWLSRALYRIRLGAFDRDALDAIDPGAAVVFVMNHRSNMDYVLVTWLAARTSALSYAVGEWARVWPLSPVIRAMGAYFIRRRDRGALYRRVLQRYVQMATAGGVTQAIFPEGGLSLTGRMATPKTGLLGHIVEDYGNHGRDVIFVPVALNYDRVLEDRVLIGAAAAGNRRFRVPPSRLVGAVLAHLWQRISGRFRSFGTASVGFGRPLSLAEFLGGATPGPQDTARLAHEMKTRIEEVMPVLPVPLVAGILLDVAPLPPERIEIRVAARLGMLHARGVALPRRDAKRITADALEILRKRGLLREGGEGLRPAPGAEPLLRFYADSVAHHFAPARLAAPVPAAIPLPPAR
ncbi:1-acyl-sn-glycerol-3-phosphate acyltransferase [Limimaricola sp. G21655-S1]|uniref:1-acyl-sn-glycerol-3-phosphate acyltransferase n=1 Tax=Limimaricola sp. G21655-S1 TaxID=3014768 RepID=UPI0022B05B49|nr:1-acyl-sn-glycerol-3-phosphate acyltransferase [Limimaricola sp. G21655-S1]MCZ4261733.1 1-acyl-sn-glycerol-3-phosphate acyltransferase [Limimaricola sp. G21655-S1]